MLKLRPNIVLPPDERFENHFDGLEGDAWREFRRLYPGVAVRRVFTAVPLERLKQLADKACQCDSTYQRADLSAYFEIEGPWSRKEASAAVRVLRAWKSVEAAYVEPTPTKAAAINPGDYSRFPNQGYLQPAPGGIDAVFAWGQPGGGGDLQDFIDLEFGWTLNHKDLEKRGIQLLHGQIDNDSRPHGTSVLGIICAADYASGDIGVAPNLGSVQVVSSYPGSQANAILAAANGLPPGGVLLIEAQEVDIEDEPALPVEAVQAEFDMIRQTTALGIIVVECAGNGGKNLDTVKNEGGDHLFKRDFRDSGAIIVGAANVTTEPTRARFFNSNFGSRVDCYAWGEDIDTADSTDTAPFSRSKHRGDFGETSGAAAIIAGAALCLQGAIEASGQQRLNAFQMRAMLCDTSNGTPSHNPPNDRIGVMPDLHKIMQSNSLVVPANVNANANANANTNVNVAEKEVAKTGGMG